MKEVSNFVIDRCFNTIWEFWPNKTKGDNAPRKAISVALKSGYAEQDLVKACRIYALQSEGEEIQYIKLLHNFINGNEWLDILEGNSLEALEAQRLEAVEVVEAWNAACRSHWHKVIGIDTRVPIAKLALQDKEFKKNWKKSLDKAKEIFQYRFNDSDIRSKINLTFTWFTSVSITKHTVLKILEGEFGSPEKERRIKSKPSREITDEERARMLMDWEEITGKRIERPASREEKREEKKPSEPTKPDTSLGHSQDYDPYGFH